MRRKNWKRALALVVAGTVCQFGLGGGCLGTVGQSILFGVGFGTGTAVADALGLANILTPTNGTTGG